MKTNLMRTAYNLIIYEALGLHRRAVRRRTATRCRSASGLPMFIRGLSDAIKAKIAFYGPDGIEPGDILLTNDAYIMGSHLNHMIFTLPIFHDGELVGVRLLDGALDRRRRHARRRDAPTSTPRACSSRSSRSSSAACRTTS